MLTTSGFTHFTEVRMNKVARWISNNTQGFMLLCLIGLGTIGIGINVVARFKAWDCLRNGYPASRQVWATVYCSKVVDGNTVTIQK